MVSTPFNVEDYLNSSGDIAAYLDAALEDGDERILLPALRDVAKAKCGIAALAEAAELNRESLYKALSKNGNLTLDTLAAVLKIFGLRLSVTKAA